jgi:hypothetical protein
MLPQPMGVVTVAGEIGWLISKQDWLSLNIQTVHRLVDINVRIVISCFGQAPNK